MSTPAPKMSISPNPERMYQWFNALVDRTEPVTEAEVREMWTDDCAMITNGVLKCAGIPAFVKHFNEIRHKLKSWKVELPLAIQMAQGNRIGVYYTIHVVMAADGAPGKVLVGAIFDVRDGKFVKMTEVAHFEGVQLHLENH